VVSAAPSHSSPLAKAIGKTSGRRRGDRDVRGSIMKGAVGRQRPRSARLAERRQTTEATNGSRSFGSAEAVSGVVKRSVPRSSRAEPRLCEAPTR